MKHVFIRPMSLYLYVLHSSSVSTPEDQSDPQVKIHSPEDTDHIRVLYCKCLRVIRRVGALL